MPYDLCEDERTLDVIESAMAKRGQVTQVYRPIIAIALWRLLSRSGGQLPAFIGIKDQQRSFHASSSSYSRSTACSPIKYNVAWLILRNINSCRLGQLLGIHPIVGINAWFQRFIFYPCSNRLFSRMQRLLKYLIKLGSMSTLVTDMCIYVST